MQWVRSRSGSGVLWSIQIYTLMSWNVWEVKYMKSYCLWPESVDHLFIQPEELRRKGRLPRITAQSKWPASVAPLLCPCAGRVTPEAGTAPVLGLLYQPYSPWYSSEPMPACNPPSAGILLFSSACSTAAPSCCCSSSWLYCIKCFGATVPFTCFLSLRWNKRGQKIAKVHSAQSQKTKRFKAWCAGSASVPVSGGFQLPPQCDPGGQLCHQPQDVCIWQHGPGWIPAAGLDSRWSGTFPYLYTIEPLPAIKLILYVQACFSN